MWGGRDGGVWGGRGVGTEGCGRECGEEEIWSFFACQVGHTQGYEQTVAMKWEEDTTEQPRHQRECRKQVPLAPEGLGHPLGSTSTPWVVLVAAL